MSIELHIVTGAAGVGKSTYGKRLADQLQAAFLDSDTVSEAVVRAGMAAADLDPTDRDGPEYKRIFRDAVYECLFATAMENLQHVSVVIVGPFTRELQTSDWPERVQRRLGVKPTVWFLACNAEVRRQRMAARSNPRDQLKLQDWQQHLEDTQNPEPAFDVRVVKTDAC